MTSCCLQDDRRDAVRRRPGWNGLDYVELAADGQTLRAFFLGKLPPELAGPAVEAIRHLRIEGGAVITGIGISGTQPETDPDPEHDDVLLMRLDAIGDFSTYTLRLVEVADLDPLYDHADFRFRTDCPSDLDCAPVCDCPPAPVDEPEIDYLAKDYQSFRQLLLDRMALLVPDWRETHAPDLGIALLELLAYTGDYLSYYQDSVGTEAYLETARQRISIRRHARLVDYRLHEGCNSRAFVCCEVDTDIALDPTQVSLITGLNNSTGDRRTVISWDDLAGVPSGTYEVFEPLYRDARQKIALRAAHSEIRFHTFGRSLCCLEQGSTAAALIDNRLTLAPGDLLILEEVRGPLTGLPEDADPTRRHPVRLTAVTVKQDPIVRGADDTPTRYLWVEWGKADALPFPLCLSAIGEAPDCRFIDNISVAHGNVILVDHGQTQPPEDLGLVPTVTVKSGCECADLPGPVTQIAGRYRPSLSGSPLTWRQPPAVMPAPAATLLLQEVCAALPQLWLPSQPAASWSVRNDLVDSGPDDADFVVEIDNQGIAHLRFGDGDLGAAPAAGTEFSAVYRVGNGPGGNVGAEAISRLVLTGTTLTGISIVVRNPLPAAGGTEPESVTQAILLAPNMFRTRLERAITADDYAAIAARDPRLQRAAAALQWTGSWYEADVAVDPLGGDQTPAPAFLAGIQRHLRPYRRIGHDLSVRPAKYVAIDLRIDGCVLPHYRRADVKAALLDAFSDRVSPGGKPGFFHPDRLSFGDGVFLSQIVATAQAVIGVEYVEVTRLHRRFEAPNHEIDNGVLPLRSWEIARLDSDPNHPEYGRLEIRLRGGR